MVAAMHITVVKVADQLSIVNNLTFAMGCHKDCAALV
jgi:hypothetical protein